MPGIVKVFNGTRWVHRPVKVLVGGVWVSATPRHLLSGAWVPAPAGGGGWPDPPAGFVEWVRLELEEGIGTPVDTSGNSRTISLGDATWSSYGGVTSLLWDGSEGFSTTIAGVPPAGSVGFRVRYVRSNTGSGGMNLFVLDTGGRFDIRTDWWDLGVSVFHQISFSDGTDSAGAYMADEGARVPYLDVVDMQGVYNAATGVTTMKLFDPDDRVTEIFSNTYAGTANAYDPGSSTECRMRSDTGREMHILDITIYTPE